MVKSPSLRSQKGQMAIFLVLVFQVLFVFFAMTINVGLVVYDKINLQNATDMAAYYGAQKQAELLNQIAHVNYQVRQAYKLLTFRLRVVGSSSVGLFSRVIPLHPIFTPPSIGSENAAYFNMANHAPAVCVGSSLWLEYSKTEVADTLSLCRDLKGFTKISLPGGTGAGSLGGSLQSFIAKIADEQSKKCKMVGVLNFQLAASFLMGYRIEAEKRGAMIDAIAANLSETGEKLVDFRGQSVYTGAKNTLVKNLTDAQGETLQMQMINSLSADVPGNCSKPEYWLPKINIFPAMTYVKMIWDGNFCSNTITPNRGGPNSIPPQDYLATVGGKNNALLTQQWMDGSSYPMGVEKNPWCMPYIGIKASTSPRKIFAPFGAPQQLQVESYAKPFGGRIGPWYSNSWSPGSPTSSGLDRIDPLLPAREGPNQGASDPNNDLVNYSKYPGDKLGMNSRYALGVMNEFFQGKVLRGAPVTKLPPVFSLDSYNHVGDPAYFEGSPDSLVRVNSKASPDPGLIRAMEEAAIAPDLFDVLYYSIETQYSSNYYNTSEDNFRSYISPYYLDLGSDQRAPYSVVDQIAKATTVFGSKSPFYMTDDPAQALTGWAQHKATDFSFPSNYYAKCNERKDAANTPAPSGCNWGGRSGYSVKIVSKSYLNTGKAPLGGASAGEGPIENPPGAN